MLLFSITPGVDGNSNGALDVMPGTYLSLYIFAIEYGVKNCNQINLYVIFRNLLLKTLQLNWTGP